MFQQDISLSRIQQGNNNSEEKRNSNNGKNNNNNNYHINPNNCHESSHNINPTINNLDKINQYQLNKNIAQKSLSIPISKLGCYNIYLRKDKKFIKHSLPKIERNSQQQFQKYKQYYESDIQHFIKTYKNINKAPNKQSIDLDDQQHLQRRQAKLMKNMSSTHSINNKGYHQKSMLTSLQLRKKGSDSSLKYSMSKNSLQPLQTQGGYFFNNWRSYQTYHCKTNISNQLQRISIESLIPRLFYSIIDMNYDMAIGIIDRLIGRQLNLISYQSNQFRFVKKGEPHHNVHISQTIPSEVTKSKNDSILASIRIIIKGLKTLCTIIKIEDDQNENSDMSDAFFNRNNHDISNQFQMEKVKFKINLLSLSQSVQMIAKTKLDQKFRSDKGDHLSQYDQHQNRSRKNSPQLLSPSNLTPPPSPGKLPMKHIKSSQSLINYRKKTPLQETKQSQSWRKFTNLSFKQKKICILNNMKFLTEFAAKIKLQLCTNDYYKLILYFLKNSKDQLKNTSYQSNEKLSQAYRPMFPSEQQLKISSDYQEEFDRFQQFQQNNKASTNQQDFLYILLKIKNIKIHDRINYATRLLPKEKKIIFAQKLGKQLLKLPYLENLLYFTKSYKQQLSKTLGELTSYHLLKQTKRTYNSATKKRKNSQNVSIKNQTQKQIQNQKMLLKRSINKSISNKQQIGKRLETICQNYIDQYGDLATIAYLSYDYNCLVKFNDYYRESLLLSYEEQELQKFDSKKYKTSDQTSSDNKNIFMKPQKTFLSYVNFKHQKISDHIREQNLQVIKRKCQICQLKMLGINKKDCYIQCSKCKHGGHLEHLTKWYANYQHCPNIDCACLCN